MTPRVDYLRKYKGPKHQGIYIGRPSKWGNPFRVGVDGTKEEVISRYKEYVLANEFLMDSLFELEDKVLLCWCYPAPCHGNALVEIISSLSNAPSSSPTASSSPQ